MCVGGLGFLMRRAEGITSEDTALETEKAYVTLSKLVFYLCFSFLLLKWQRSQY